MTFALLTNSTASDRLRARRSSSFRSAGANTTRLKFMQILHHKLLYESRTYYTRRICWNFFGSRFKALVQRKARPFDRWFPSVSGKSAEFCMKQRCTELVSGDTSNIDLSERKEGRTDAQ